MKITVTISILLLSFSLSFAQSEADYCNMIREASTLYCSKKYKEAVKALNSQSGSLAMYDSSKSVALATGKVYFEAKKYKQAKKVFKKIVAEKKYPKNEIIFDYSKCFQKSAMCPGFIVCKRLLENQHDACVMLAKIEMKQKNYDEALEQIKNADIYYRFWYGCGTTDLENDLKLSLLYADYYKKTGSPDSAIQKLVKNILEPAAMPVPYYEEVVEEASKMIKKYYSKQDRTKMINEAIDNLYFQTFGSQHQSKVSRTYFIKFLGVEIKAAPEYLFEHNMNKEEVKQYIRQTDFYKAITE